MNPLRRVNAPQGMSRIRRRESFVYVADIGRAQLSARAPGLARLARPQHAVAPDPAAAVLDWLGCPVPAGPAELRLVGETGTLPAPSGHVLAMDPVSLAADMRELHLVDAAPDLAIAEAEQLAATVRSALSPREMELVVAAPGRWYALSRRRWDFSAPAPVVAAAVGVRASMPRGPDGLALRALMNEIQMVWHEHAVNLARAARGLPPVNSVWIWGAGGPDEGRRPACDLPPLLGEDPLLRGLWRRLGGELLEVSDDGECFAALRRGSVAALRAADLERCGVERLARWRRLRVVLADGTVLDLSPWRRVFRGQAGAP